METKPLPCPFCGGEARIVEGDYTAWEDGYAVRCDNCALTLGASGRLGEAYVWTCCYDSEAAAVEAWNTRTGYVGKQGEIMLMGNRVFIEGFGHYAKESTCQIVSEEEIEIPDQDPWYGMLGTGITRYKLSCGHETLGLSYENPKRCSQCGARVKEADDA